MANCLFKRVCKLDGSESVSNLSSAHQPSVPYRDKMRVRVAILQATGMSKRSVTLKQNNVLDFFCFN